MSDNSDNAERHEVRLVDIPVNDQNMALNLMVAFLNLAQKRGAFSFEESSKILSCVNLFAPTSETATSNTPPPVVPELAVPDAGASAESVTAESASDAPDVGASAESVTAESTSDAPDAGATADSTETEDELKAKLAALEEQLETPRE